MKTTTPFRIVRRLARQSLAVVGLFTVVSGFAETESSPNADGSSKTPENFAADDPVELPAVTINAPRLSDYPPIPRKDLKGGGLSLKEPPVSISYPGRAYFESVPKGSATVCVEVDEKGQAVDYLLIAYTEKYFGDALLRNAKRTWFRPLLFKGVAIPARFNFGYEFKPEFTMAMSSFDAVTHRALEIHGGRPDYKYQPVQEEKLDSRLQYTRQAVPNFPVGFKATGGKEDWVMVSLYIDEQGHVRVPNVDSASSPQLIANALKAVHYWEFKPPTVKGKPVLVYAAFAVTFIQATQ